MNENNYLVQFKYNGKEYQTSFLSPCNLSGEKILEDAAFQAASDHISSNHLRVEGQIIEGITLFGKGGEKLFHKKINN